MIQSVLTLFGKVRIGPRLVGGFVLVALACAFVGYRSLGALTDVRAVQVHASSNLVPTLIHLDAARSAALRIQRAERTLLLARKRGDEKAARFAIDAIESSWRAFDDGVKGYVS